MIDLQGSTVFGNQISRDDIGTMAVTIDIIVELIFLLALWLMTFFVNLDA